MSNITEHIQILQLFISACSGFLGVGIGIGVFKSSIKQIRKDLTRVMDRQSRLRGEDNGGYPIYMSKDNCEKHRSRCEVGNHTRSIRALENYARWDLQNKGLKIEEINQILMG